MELLIYFILINIYAFVLTCYDKHCAIYNKRRISEKMLFTIAIAGGSVGVYLAMQIVRHKTKHLNFMIGIPVIFIIQVFLLAFLRFAI